MTTFPRSARASRYPQGVAAPSIPAPHLPCAVHPYKIDSQCPAYELETSLPDVELWEPEGASY